MARPRTLRCAASAAAVLVLGASGSSSAAAASPAPAWSLQLLAQPTSMSSDRNTFCEGSGISAGTQCDRYDLTLVNVGGLASSGPITVTDTLPEGMSVEGPVSGASGVGRSNSFMEWSCLAELLGGHEVITCNSEASVPALTPAAPIRIPVTVTATAGTLVNEATVQGGGAPTLATQTPTTIGAPPEPFGLLEFNASALDPAGALATQAAAHPAGLTASFAFPSAFKGLAPSVGSLAQPVEHVKQIVTDLPPGLIGDALAAPTCPLSDLTNLIFTREACPAGSQVGNLVLTEADSIESELKIFNVTPEHGYPAEFGVFEPNLKRAELLYASVVGSGAGAHVRLTSAPQNWGGVNEVGFSLTFFGNPAAVNQSHEAEIPFAANPSDCSAAGFTTTIHVDSWEHPGAHNPNTSPNFSDPNWKGATSQSPPVTGCQALQFQPRLSLHPDTAQADSPAGLNVDLEVPQNEEPEGLATPPLRDATVTLPRGLAVNPSSADGLAGCSPAQIAADTNDPGACPAASQIGTVELETPVLDHVLHGRVFLGTPACAPCGNADAQQGKLIHLYIEVNDPQTGVVVKLPGSAGLDPASGQITASFEENPQFPFENLMLAFKTGDRATLTTPSTCGAYTTTTDLKPWSAPQSGPDATPSSEYKVTSGPGGSACATTEAAQPNKPAFSAGALTPAAGAYSPFVLKLTRENGSQRIKGIDTTLPKGLTGKLAGIPYCSEAQIAAAGARGGNAEKQSPSCPLASEVGTVNVGAGSGAPFYVQGHAYLAGPYKGAPLSLAIITPAVAGPFDLGTVVVRTALYVDPETAQIHAVSDPIPTILAGVPLDVRSIALNMSRPSFTLNPTSCDPMAILAAAATIPGQTASLSSPFQVGGCRALGFRPKLAIRLKGGTKRNKNPALTATVTYPKGAYANIASASVGLPHSEFLDQAHIKTICTRVQFAEGNVPGEKCPPGSIYGFAKATTPLLDKPLEGPVYLRSSSHKLPDLVASLHGQVDVVLDGRVDTDPQDGIRNSFEMVPDAPVTKFTLSMQGGKKGLLVNSENICAKPQRATARFTAQNGKTDNYRPLIANSCKGKGKRHKHKGQ